MDVILIIIGLIILLTIFFDFFHTTLSGNGFGFISAQINFILAGIILKNRSKLVFRFSGLLHLMVTTATWFFFLILGTFIIFLSREDMVLNLNTKIPATIIERFYYTCYLLSTLGIGDFVPGNNVSRIISSILSFSGFILLTIAMTYLISVINALLSKRKFALYISTLGENIEELYKFFMVDESLSTLTQKSSDLRQLILENASNYIAFPIVHHYLTHKKSHSLVVQLASLYEVLMVLRNDFWKESTQYAKIQSILGAIAYYLKLGPEGKKDYRHEPEHLANLRCFWSKYGHTYKNDLQKDKAISASLKSAGWTWEDVYKIEDK